MLKYLLPISIVYVVLAIIGVIMIVKEVKKNDNKEDMTLTIISFLVPIIGLIIYAVNVGKDKHITECALKGLKMYIKFLVAQFIISLITILLMIFVFNANTTHKKVMNKIDTPTTEVTPQEIEKKIQSNSYVSYADVRESGRFIYISITFIDNTSESKAKEIAKSSLDYFDSSYIEKYDFDFIIKTNDDTLNIIGHKNNTSSNIVWSN